ncbi:tetratricopeptide repeat protein [Lacipirellula parvula]|uniref:Uncharacterized protein n=1 Tax=Lacipirellula parvula TaxID=2650471 RepID=A0A5K7XL16_9BACT|nr:tetratricopeptide repeat protein [Lacipirellula parvula]BBO33639.1 hypothetical protein PLANPX_3251 [Lacipirellula parvula]
MSIPGISTLASLLRMLKAEQKERADAAKSQIAGWIRVRQDDEFKRLIVEDTVITTRVEKRLLDVDTRLEGLEELIAGSVHPSTTPQTEPSAITAATDAGVTALIEEAVSYMRRNILEVATEKLLELRNSPHWPSMTPRQRFRIVANLGQCKTRIEEFGRALAYFEEALLHQPDDIEAQALVATAHFSAGDDKEAERRAREILEQHPDTPFAHLVLIRLDDTDTSTEDIWNGLPPSVKYDVNILATTAWRAHRLMEFDFALFLASEGIKDEANRLGFEVLQNVVAVNRIYVAHENHLVRSPEETSVLEAAISRFETLAEQIVAEPGRQHRGQFYFYYAGALRLLGKAQEASHVYKQAVRAWPAATDIGRQYAQLLRDLGEIDEAIEALQANSFHSSDPKSCVFLSFLLADRDTHEDREVAAELLSGVVQDGVEVDLRELSNAIKLLGLLRSKQGSVDGVIDKIRTLSRADLSQAHRDALIATCYGVAKNFEEADSHARLAVSQLLPTDDETAWIDAALACRGCKLHAEAVAAFSQIVTPQSPLNQIEWLLESAYHSDSVGAILNFCSKLREDGVFLEEAIDLEVYNREKYSDIDGALEVLDAYIALNNNDDFTKLVKLRKALIGAIHDRPEVAKLPIEELPTWEEATPEIGKMVVVLLRERGDSELALDYAYRLLQKNHDSADAHRAFLTACGEPGKEHSLPSFESAQPGAAVEYMDVSSGDIAAWILEDSSLVDRNRRELDLSHPTAQDLLGKSLGDEFLLRTSGTQRHHGRILRIISKYQYVYKDIMDNWQERFPDDPQVQRFSSVNADGDPDFSPIFQILDHRAAVTAQLHKVYKDNPLSVTSFAAMSGVDAFDATSHLAAQGDIDIRCCQGNELEYDQALLRTGLSSQLVLCESAIATLWQTQIWKSLNHTPTLIVNLGVMQQVRRKALDGTFLGKGFLSKVGEQYRYDEYDPELINARDTEFRDFYQWLASHSQAENGLALADLSPHKRKYLTEFFGFGAAQTIATAMKFNLVLWTDDLTIAEVSRIELNVERTWTEIVVQNLANLGQLSAAVLTENIARLNGCRYTHARLTPDAILASAQIANWDYSAWPFPSVVTWCGRPEVNRFGIAKVSAHALPLLYAAAPSVDAAHRMSKAMLEGVLTIGEGKYILRAIRKNLHRLFDCDTDAYSDCDGLIGYLLKSHL